MVLLKGASLNHNICQANPKLIIYKFNKMSQKHSWIYLINLIKQLCRYDG